MENIHKGRKIPTFQTCRTVRDTLTVKKKNVFNDLLVNEIFHLNLTMLLSYTHVKFEFNFQKTRLGNTTLTHKIRYK